MVELVSQLRHSRTIAVYCDLNLAEELLVEFCNKSDIPSELSQAIFYLNDAKFVWVIIAEFLEMLKQLLDFFLVGADLASHEVAEGKGDKVGWGRPGRIFHDRAVKLFGHSQ